MKRTCLLAILLIALGASAAEKPYAKPIWTVDLVAKYGFTPFQVWRGGWPPFPPMWANQQGTVFVSPETLAVYQVQAGDQPGPLKPRGESGGGGKYTLRVVFIDPHKGEEIKTLRLTTSGSDYSGVYPTHDGMFVVRTGLSLRVYSRTLEEITSRRLPQLSDPYVWFVSVSPPGSKIHVETLNLKLVLDADTLETIGSDSSEAGWRGADSDPWITACPREGRWTSAKRLAERLCLAYGHKKLRVSSPDGQILWDMPMRDEVVSVLGTETVLAAEVHAHRPDPFDMGIESKPLRIEVYDLATKSQKCSIRIGKSLWGGWQGETILYALSPSGTVAVIQANTLSLYRP